MQCSIGFWLGCHFFLNKPSNRSKIFMLMMNNFLTLAILDISILNNAMFMVYSRDPPLCRTTAIFGSMRPFKPQNACSVSDKHYERILSNTTKTEMIPLAMQEVHLLQVTQGWPNIYAELAHQRDLLCHQ